MWKGISDTGHSVVSISNNVFTFESLLSGVYWVLCTPKSCIDNCQSHIYFLNFLINVSLKTVLYIYVSKYMLFKFFWTMWGSIALISLHNERALNLGSALHVHIFQRCCAKKSSPANKWLFLCLIYLLILKNRLYSA